MATAMLSRVPGQSASAAAWSVLSYVAGKEGDRNQLAPGLSSEFDLAIVGRIDGQPVDHRVAGRLNVGHDGTRSSTSTPELPKIVAAILGKLNAATREAILRDLPAEFTANDCDLPTVDSELIKQSERLLKSLRRAKQSPVRGPVSVEYASLDAGPVVSIVG